MGNEEPVLLSGRGGMTMRSVLLRTRNGAEHSVLNRPTRTIRPGTGHPVPIYSPSSKVDCRSGFLLSAYRSHSYPFWYATIARLRNSRV